MEQIVHRVAEFSKKIQYLILINSIEYLIAQVKIKCNNPYEV